MEPVNDIERKVGEQRKKIKAENIMVEAYVERIKCLGEEISGFKLKSWRDKETIKEIMLKNAKANQTVEELSRKLSACEDAKKMSDWVQDDMKRRELENLRCVDDLRWKSLEADRNVEELKRRMLAYEEEKKTASRVQDVRELENLQRVEDLRRQNLESNPKVEELRSQVLAFEEDKKTLNLVLEIMKTREIEHFRCLEDLRRKKLEADLNVDELRSRMLAYEEEKKTASRVQEVRELENLQCVGDLRRQNLESNRKVEELRSQVLAFEEDKKTGEREHFRCLEDLRRKNSEAYRKVKELEDRVSALEEENRTAVRVWEEMKVREIDSERRLEGLEQKKLEADKRMNEMKARESDLRRQILEADDRVKEMEGRSLKACKAAEVNVERFGNVLAIAEDLWKLLDMNMDDLLSVKKFGFGTDEEGLISSAVVSGDSRAGAITTNGVAVISGSHARNKAVEELTVSATEQPTKKRKTNKSLSVRKWIFGADMVKAFEDDDELCLHAVCALYRQHVSTSQPTESSKKRFYHFEALRGVELAGCLINGDPEHSSLTRPVDEIKQRYPDIVNQCRRLAICYSSYFTAMPRTNEPLSPRLL